MKESKISALAKVRGELPSRGGDPEYERPEGSGRDLRRKEEMHRRGFGGHHFTAEERRAGHESLQKAGGGKKDREGLTRRQRLWMEAVTDFRHTIYECARVAGYANPEQAVRQLYDNPYVLRAILRRYHRRMLQFARVFGPQLKFVKNVPKPSWRGPGVKIRGGMGKEEEAMRVPVAEGVSVDSLLGEGK